MTTISIPLDSPLDTDAAFAQITGGIDVPQLTDWQLKTAEQYMITPEQIAKLYDVPLDMLTPKPIDFTKTIADTSGFSKLVQMLVRDASNPACDPSLVSAELLAGLGLDDPEQRRKTAWLFESADRILARDGWCQNVLHQPYAYLDMRKMPVELLSTTEIKPSYAPPHETRYKHCTLGAFVMAVTGRMVERLEPGSAHEMEYNRMALFLSHSLAGTPVPAWNDHPAREAHHVHRALQTCTRYLAAL